MRNTFGFNFDQIQSRSSYEGREDFLEASVFSQRKREREREWGDGWIRVTVQDRSRINDACTRIPWTCAGVRGNRRLSRCLQLDFLVDASTHDLSDTVQDV